ncbi:MAG: DMT family transporter [Nodularia sp. CChRGM 3473]
MFMSLVIDMLGLFGAIKYPLTTPRILGIATLLTGLRQKLGPNVAQTSFISSKYVTIKS